MLDDLIPEPVIAWWHRRRAFADLEAMLARELRMLVLDDDHPINRAKSAIGVGDTAAALHFWAEAQRRYPALARTSHEGLEILLGLGRYDEAETLMQDGKRRKPGDHFYASGYALVAERRGNLKEAIERWRRVRKKFPLHWMGYVHGAVCARQTGDFRQAEALLKDAARRFPEVVKVWFERACTAEQMQQWPEALDRWKILSERFNHAGGVVGATRVLRNLGRFDEAEELLENTRFRFSNVVEMQLELAEIAYARGDKEEAVRRWAETRRRFSSLPFGYQGEMRVLRELGRFGDAEIVLSDAAEQFSAVEWPWLESASLAEEQEKWAEALNFWEVVRTRWPEREDGYIRAAGALSKLSRNEEAAELIRQYHSRNTQ